MMLSRIYMYGSQGDFPNLMYEIRKEFGIVFLAWRSQLPIRPVDDFPKCEPFGPIGCMTWPDFLDDVHADYRTINDGRKFYFVKDESFCFRGRWSKFDENLPSNCDIEYQMFYYRNGVNLEKPDALTIRYKNVSRFVKRRLRHKDGYYHFDK